jgi:hypothetical protein
MSLIEDTRLCGNEDAKGRVCRFGANHRSACQFGELRLSDKQITALVMLRDKGNRGSLAVFAPGSEYLALERRGLVLRRFIGQRWWRFTLLPAGLAAVETVS